MCMSHTMTARSRSIAVNLEKSDRTVALIVPSERTCPPGVDERPAEFMRSLRWKQFTDLWVTERRRQLQAAQESKR